MGAGAPHNLFSETPNLFDGQGFEGHPLDGRGWPTHPWPTKGWPINLRAKVLGHNGQIGNTCLKVSSRFQLLGAIDEGSKLV